MSFLIACLFHLSPVRAQEDSSEAWKQIDATLVRMSRAVQAADKGDFLSCLDLSNGFFYMEQAHWCDDLTRRGIQAVRFQRTHKGDRIDGNTAHATIRIHYTSRTGAATDGATASWPALFVHRNQEWLYAGEDWKVLQGDGFVVRYLPGSEAAALAARNGFPIARAHDNEGFGVNPGPQQIELFRDMEHLKATVYVNQPDEVLMGWNEPGESIKFMDIYAHDAAGWAAAFAHEYGHVCTWEFGDKIKDAPWWVSEGVAELAAEGLTHDRERVHNQIIRRAKAGRLVPWADIADYDKAAQKNKHMAYIQGHHMLGYISQEWGREGRNRWLRALGRGDSLDEACRGIMGMSFADLDRAWRRTLPAPTPSEERLAAVRAQLELTLHAMESAATTGDTQAWLATIARGDNEFLKEQTYFAKDLHKKPAAECTITMGDLTLRDDTLEGPITFTWSMGEHKKPRTIKFDARFVQADDDRPGNASTWLYAGETWQRRVASGAVVMFDEGLESAADEALKSFALVRDRVETGFNLNDAALPHKTQKIKLYSSMRHLQQSICLSYTDGLGGWNEPGESIKLLVGPGSKSGGLRSVIAHEYGHVATFELGPKSNDMAWWILEGVADLSAEVYGHNSKFIENAARKGTLAPWSELANFETCKPQYQTYVYHQGHHMLGYISDRWGKDKRIEWMRVMSNGATLDEGTRRVLGRSFEQLDREWRATLPPKEEAKEPEEPSPSAP